LRFGVSAKPHNDCDQLVLFVTTKESWTLESCGSIITFGKEGSENTLLLRAAVFVARMERCAVGRACGKPLFRKVSSTEP